MASCQFNYKIAVCVATYKRPRYLAELLSSLAELDDSGMDAVLLLCDNDARQLAAPVIDRYRDIVGMPMHYIVEPRRGIASARNRLVAEAHKLGVSWIAFVDDDEIVSRDWLKNLLSTAQTYGAAAVAGVSEVLFEPDVPGWYRTTSLINTRRVRTGRKTHRFDTANVLISTRILGQIPGPFDQRFNLTGGSDTMLSAIFTREGHPIVMCAEAITFEKVPASRTTWKYIVMRGFRSGVGAGRAAVWSTPEVKPIVLRIAKSVATIGFGVTSAPFRARYGRAGLVEPVQYIASGVGSLLGLIGIGMHFEEYRETHGE